MSTIKRYYPLHRAVEQEAMDSLAWPTPPSLWLCVQLGSDAVWELSQLKKQTYRSSFAKEFI